MAILAFTVIIKRMVKKIDMQIDEDNIQPSDFCVMFEDIPTHKTKQEFETHLNENISGLEIVNIVYTYKIYNLLENMRRKQNLEDEIERKKRLKDELLIGMDCTEEEARAEGVPLEELYTAKVSFDNVIFTD